MPAHVGDVMVVTKAWPAATCRSACSPSTAIWPQPTASTAPALRLRPVRHGLGAHRPVHRAGSSTRRAALPIPSVARIPRRHPVRVAHRMRPATSNHTTSPSAGLRRTSISCRCRRQGRRRRRERFGARTRRSLARDRLGGSAAHAIVTVCQAALSNGIGAVLFDVAHHIGQRPQRRIVRLRDVDV